MAARDILYIPVVLLVMGIAMFGVYNILNTSIDQMIDVPTVNESKPTVAALEGAKSVTNRYDKIFFGLFIGLVLSLIITSWFIGAHPVFIILYLLIAMFSVALNAIYSNVWKAFSETAALGGGVETAFPIMNHILTYLPIYGSAIAIIGMVVMFAKPYLSEGGMR